MRCGGMSAFSELEFDPPVAAVGDLVVAGIDRAVLADTGGGKMFWWEPLPRQKLDPGNCPGGRELPIGAERGVANRRPVGMAVDTQDPVDAGRDPRRYFFQGFGQLPQLGLAIGAEA